MRFIIVDLEATCWENVRSYARMEMIEIGAVEMLSPKSPPAREFNSFVRPVVEPQLSRFCVELTTIDQHLVDEADTFPVVFQEFLNWIGPEPYYVCSWGGYDQTQFKIDCERHDITFPPAFENHINVKKEFAKVKGVKSCGMKRALSIANIPLEGTHHRGIDDSRNIAKLSRLVLPKLNLTSAGIDEA